MAELRKAILVTTYNKTNELKMVLAHLECCSAFNNYQLVIVYHEEVAKTVDFVNSLKLSNCLLVSVNGTGRSKLENMNRNRIIGLDYCFDQLAVDYVVAIEDDVLCGYDTLVFCQKMIDLYGADQRFRGINLGSKELFNEAYRDEYGMFRYGLFGQGGAVTKETWARIKRLNILSNLKDHGFDFLVEYYYKTGFVIMPRCSRYIDVGWNGTHAPKDPEHDYYQSLRASWVGIAPFTVPNYRQTNFKFKWRDDCIQYSSLQNFKFEVKFIGYRAKKLVKSILAAIGLLGTLAGKAP